MWGSFRTMVHIIARYRKPSTEEAFERILFIIATVFVKSLLNTGEWFSSTITFLWKIIIPNIVMNTSSIITYLIENTKLRYLFKHISPIWYICVMLCILNIDETNCFSEYDETWASSEIASYATKNYILLIKMNKQKIYTLEMKTPQREKSATPFTSKYWWSISEVFWSILKYSFDSSKFQIRPRYFYNTSRKFSSTSDHESGEVRKSCFLLLDTPV